jgi:hypothetical protein
MDVDGNWGYGVLDSSDWSFPSRNGKLLIVERRLLIGRNILTEIASTAIVMILLFRIQQSIEYVS